MKNISTNLYSVISLFILPILATLLIPIPASAANTYIPTVDPTTVNLGDISCLRIN